MGDYRPSSLDTRLKRKFLADNTLQSIRKLAVVKGRIRGLSQGFSIDFQYPITALCGANGSGKSTVLGLTACAFHNVKTGYNPRDRKYPWYTISDFFVHLPREPQVQGVEIRYDISHNNWRVSENHPDAKGIFSQERKKKIGGRWNDYARRVRRNVLYLGVDRVVPEYEKSVYRSYKSYFEPSDSLHFEQDIADAVGYVLGNAYTDLSYLHHRGYQLPIVSRGGAQYSGFNMGAGESALLELFFAIFGCSESLLLIVDELELGLHPEAQFRLVKKLKEIVNLRKLQIVCTTHSPHILGALPPSGRVYLQRAGSYTKAIPEISTAFASGLLSGTPTGELEVLVEDNVAASILRLALTNQQRQRVNILEIGSSAAVIRHLAMRFVEGSNTPAIALLDGDQKIRLGEHKNTFLKSVETSSKDPKASAFFDANIAFLPGNTWPENWIVDQMDSPYFSTMEAAFGIDQTKWHTIQSAARLAGKHNEIHTIAELLHMSVDDVMSALVSCALSADSDARNAITETIKIHLA